MQIKGTPDLSYPLSLPHGWASTALASLLWNVQVRFERKDAEKHSLGKSPLFHFPGGSPEAASWTSICPSCAPGTSRWQWPENRKWAWHLQGRSTGWQVRETCLGPGICSLTWPPQDGPIRAVPSPRTRHCQREAEKQRLPRATGVRGLGLGRSVLLLHPRNTAPGRAGLQRPDSSPSGAPGERLRLQLCGAGS